MIEKKEVATYGGLLLLGIATTVSPCSIAIFVMVLSYILSNEGSGKDRHHSGASFGAGFAMGMSLTFFLFGVLMTYIGLFVQGSSFFYLIGGLLIVVLGLNSIFSFWTRLRDHWSRGSDCDTVPLIERIAQRASSLSESSNLLGGKRADEGSEIAGR